MTRRLKRSYLLVLGALALFSIVGLIMLQAAIERGSADSALAARAERQRARGLSLALSALAVQAAETPGLRDERAAEMAQTLNEWEAAQSALAPQAAPMASSGEALHTSAQGVLAALPSSGDPHRPDLYRYLTPLLQSQRAFGEGLGRSAADAERASEARRTALRRLAGGLLAATLLALAAAGALAFQGGAARTLAALQMLEEGEEEREAALGEADKQLAQMRHVVDNLATVDALTGLPNHRSFHETLDREMGRALRHGGALSLLLLDVDRFKPYNDAYGHPAGDEVLRQVARIVGETARVSDIAARFGGEEFALILPDTDVMGAVVLGERLRHAVADADGLERPLTASLGIATLTPGMCGVAELIAQADRALCHAKGEGRNRVSHALRLPAPLEDERPIYAHAV